MELEEFSNVAKVLNAAYAGNEPMFKSSQQMQIWHSMLQDLPYEVVQAAVKNIIARSHFRPAISDIREECANITSPPVMSEQEAWAIVRPAIRNGIYGSKEEFSKFPDVIKEAVADPGSLSEWAQLPSNEVDTVIQSLFKRNYKTVVERKKNEAVIGAIGVKAGAMQRLAENVAKRLEADYGDV